MDPILHVKTRFLGKTVQMLHVLNTDMLKIQIQNEIQMEWSKLIRHPLWEGPKRTFSLKVSESKHTCSLLYIFFLQQQILDWDRHTSRKSLLVWVGVNYLWSWEDQWVCYVCWHGLPPGVPIHEIFQYLKISCFTVETLWPFHGHKTPTSSWTICTSLALLFANKWHSRKIHFPW